MAVTTFGGRLVHAWNAFFNRDSEDKDAPFSIGAGYGRRPDRLRTRYSNERTIISSIYTRISVDVAAVNIRHVRIDQNDRFLETIDSGLNNCLSLDANIDQTGRALLQDAAHTLCEKGAIAIVAVDTSSNPNLTGAFEVQTLRIGEVLEWYPRHVKINLYNDQPNKGLREELILPKSRVAIVENPFYTVMNEQNSTLQRLIRKLAILDAIDEQSGSGKLDLIIQLPYVVKNETRKAQAEARRDQIEMQLQGSKYGVAYTDGTERITQLNRPVENNLLAQVTYLTAELYAQLGLTEETFNGKADEKAMLNYYNRTVDPIIAAISDSIKRTFLTKTARSQLQSIMYFRDPFKLVPVSNLAEIADKFTRNEILSSNEIRGIIGYKPSSDPNADALRNKNLNPTGTPVDPNASAGAVDPNVAPAGVSVN